MTMRILNMITFCVTVIQSAIHTTKTTYTIHSTPKKGPMGVRGWRGRGVVENERKSPRDVPLVIIIIESFIPGLSFSLPLRSE